MYSIKIALLLLIVTTVYGGWGSIGRTVVRKAASGIANEVFDQGEQESELLFEQGREAVYRGGQMLTEIQEGPADQQIAPEVQKFFRMMDLWWGSRRIKDQIQQKGNRHPRMMATTTTTTPSTTTLAQYDYDYNYE